MFYKLSCSMVVSTTLAVLLTTTNPAAHASVTPDRTRLVFNESDKSISVTLRNNNEKLPYLAQSWLEDEKGNKITSPLAVLPPVQRIDAMMNGQVKIQALPDIHTLPSDRESLFYYNVREIPPKSGKANTLQIALQTRIKLFWRPKALEKIDMKNRGSLRSHSRAAAGTIPSITQRRIMSLSAMPVRRKGANCCGL